MIRSLCGEFLNNDLTSQIVDQLFDYSNPDDPVSDINLIIPYIKKRFSSFLTFLLTKANLKKSFSFLDFYHFVYIFAKRCGFP